MLLFFDAPDGRGEMREEANETLRENPLNLKRKRHQVGEREREGEKTQSIKRNFRPAPPFLYPPPPNPDVQVSFFGNLK